jgi:hypothetical protein
MSTHIDKTQKNKSQAVSAVGHQKQAGGESPFQFYDKRPEALTQRILQKMANESPQAKQTAQLQTMAHNRSGQQQPSIQKKENNTGLPDHLKTGMEHLSGMSLDDVKVHRNSDKPAGLQAHAYAQGTDIHLGPDQEKHLPHEAWHVVQQKQGRVKPTMQMKGNVQVNDDAVLEKEADIMGAKAATSQLKGKNPAIANKGQQSKTAQLLKQSIENEDWDTLKAQAEAAKGPFDEIFEALIAKTGAMKEKYTKVKKKMVPNPANAGKSKVARYEKKEVDYSGVAGLKGEARATQKAEGKYEGKYSQILDVVRGTLTFKNFQQMIKGLSALKENESLGFKVVRCKQTYKTDDGKTGSQTLYGDIKMNIEELSTGHICEIQFTLKDLIDVKQKGHHSYEEMRDNNPFGDKVLKANKGKDNKTKGHIKRAVHGSYAAYTKARLNIEKDAAGLDAAISLANEMQAKIDGNEQ